MADMFVIRVTVSGKPIQTLFICRGVRFIASVRNQYFCHRE